MKNVTILPEVNKGNNRTAIIIELNTQKSKETGQKKFIEKQIT
jgi:hypothetical protein